MLLPVPPVIPAYGEKEKPSEEELKAWATVRSDALRIAGDPVDEYDRE